MKYNPIFIVITARKIIILYGFLSWHNQFPWSPILFITRICNYCGFKCHRKLCLRGPQVEIILG